MKKIISKKRVVLIIAIFWLIFVTAFGSGICVYATKKWPYPIIHKIENFIAGDSEEKTNLIEKIKNDLDIVPARHIEKLQKTYEIPEKYKSLDQLPIKKRRKKPRTFISNDAPEGYRLIYGVFDFNKSLHGAVLFDPEGNVKNIWHLSQEDVEWVHRSDTTIFPHGFVIAPDGSIVTAYDGGTTLTKYDFCGNIIWRIKGGFHHSIAFDEESAIWTWGNAGVAKPYWHNLIKVDYQTGKVLKEFRMDEVVNANLDIDIFGILQEDSAGGSKWINDKAGGKWHVNDIDPLPKKIAKHYPEFNSGDLLLSLRSPDLICVIDPDTYKVKWWRQGLSRRQHDPDWNDKGTITIFNNNMHRGYSSIIELNPVSYEYRHVVNGKQYDFYTWIQGKHQRLSNGGYLITSPRQGRVFEINRDGDITFDFINIYGGQKKFLAISEAVFLPLDYFKELSKCKN